MMQLQNESRQEPVLVCHSLRDQLILHVERYRRPRAYTRELSDNASSFDAKRQIKYWIQGAYHMHSQRQSLLPHIASQNLAFLFSRRMTSSDLTSHYALPMFRPALNFLSRHCEQSSSGLSAWQTLRSTTHQQLQQRQRYQQHRQRRQHRQRKQYQQRQQHPILRSLDLLFPVLLLRMPLLLSLRHRRLSPPQPLHNCTPPSSVRFSSPGNTLIWHCTATAVSGKFTKVCFAFSQNSLPRPVMASSR